MRQAEREGFLAHAKLPVFRRRVDKAIATIRETVAIGTPYVGVSWGKDSIVLLHLCQQIEPNIIAVHFSDPTEDLQDNYSQTRDRYFNAQPTNYLDVSYEPDSRGLRGAGDALNFDVSILGCRKQESKYRAISISKYGLIHQYQSGRWRCFPLGFWSDIDVWAYICQHKLPYLESYDRDRFGRTMVAHNFCLHQYDHTDAVLTHGYLSKLKRERPKYFAEYVKRFPEIAIYA